MSMIEFENELISLANLFYQSPDNQNLVEEKIKELKTKNEYLISIFNLISNPQISEQNALFFIGVLKSDIKKNKKNPNPSFGNLKNFLWFIN